LQQVSRRQEGEDCWIRIRCL